MMVNPNVKEQDIQPAETSAFCSTCSAHAFNPCHEIHKAALEYPDLSPVLLKSTENAIPPRRLICREQDTLDFVPVICQGWAACAVALADGRRQILSFLLPGDIVSMALLFEPTANYMVEAITEVRYCAFNRAGLKAILFKQPDLFAKFSQAWIEERVRADQLIVDLGRRSAEERIARLILGLMDRLARRGMVQNETMDFPLRQHHIADASGLTPVHVNKVLSEFRRSGLIKLSDRSLTVLDPAGFRRIGSMR